VLNGHGDRPLVNRAVSGQYPPGSIFKPVVAIAALESGVGIGPSTHYQCPGYYELNSKRRLKCWNWKSGGHGTLALVKSIEQSCNTYFCYLGARCGYKNIYRVSAALGLGRRTGIELDAEQTGLLPHPDRVRYKGDIAIVSIGQGRLLVTPLQMALVTASIANGGYVYRPRLVQAVRRSGETDFEKIQPYLEHREEWGERTLESVRKGMRDVVNAPTGTGKRARVSGLVVAGKTGTAEFGRKSESRKRGWMIAFAPFDEPQVAVAIVLEDAVSGGRSVAPRMGRLLAGIFDKAQTHEILD
jgi:penicillin-binding protein 2